jgi:hypothetical protein
MSSNVWSYLLNGALERERAIAEMTVTTNTNSVVSTNWAYPNGYDRLQYVSSYRVETGLYVSSMATQTWTTTYRTNIGTTNAPIYTNVVFTNSIVLTNWSIGYSQTVSIVTGWFGVVTNVTLPTRTNVLGRAITFDLLSEIDGALLSMATNFIDYRGASASTGIEEPMALPTGTNWFWLSNVWVQVDMGIDYDHYTYRETPPVWTLSNAFQYLHIGTALVYKVINTNKEVQTVPGYTLGQYNVKNVTRTNLMTTNTWTRYRFLSQPGTNMAPVLMGQMHCVVTQADTLVASGFGNSADGVYRWASSDGNGFGTWTHEVSTNPSVIVQSNEYFFTLATNGTTAAFTLYDYTAYRGGEFLYQWRGVGRGQWLDVSNNAAGITTVSNGWLGWDWDKAYEYYWHNYSPYPYDLPIDRLEPTNVSPALVALALQDTNYNEAISIPLAVTGPVYVAGVTFGNDAFGFTHVRTGVTYTVMGSTGHLGVAIYDVDYLSVPGWSEYWAGGSNVSLKGSTITLWYTNQVPQFGTPRHLTKEALNERWKLLNVYRSTWRMATLEPGRRYRVAASTDTNSFESSTCFLPGLGTISISNNAPIDPTMRYQWTYECNSQVRKDFGPTIFRQFGVHANEEAQWFETTATVSRCRQGRSRRNEEEVGRGWRESHSQITSNKNSRIAGVFVMSYFVTLRDWMIFTASSSCKAPNTEWRTRCTAGFATCHSSVPPRSSSL